MYTAISAVATRIGFVLQRILERLGGAGKLVRYGDRQAHLQFGFVDGIDRLSQRDAFGQAEGNRHRREHALVGDAEACCRAGNGRTPTSGTVAAAGDCARKRACRVSGDCQYFGATSITT